jgi:hypothetical protein
VNTFAKQKEKDCSKSRASKHLTCRIKRLCTTDEIFSNLHLGLRARKKEGIYQSISKQHEDYEYIDELQKQQSDRFDRIHRQHQLSSTSSKIFTGSSSKIVEFIQIDRPRNKSRKLIYSRQAMRRVTIKLGYASWKRKKSD